MIAAGGNYSDTVTISAGSARRHHRQRDRAQRRRPGRHRRRHHPDDRDRAARDRRRRHRRHPDGQDGQIGALSGTADDFSGSAPLKLTLFNANAALKAGQELVTFGSVGGRPYVPGIPIGRITTVTTEPGSLTPTALVKPFADFTGLGVLGVVVSK